MLGSISTDIGEILELKNNEEFEALKNSTKEIRDPTLTHNPKGVVVLCWASWYEPCNVLKDSVLPELSKIYKHLAFAWVDCDKFVDLVDKYEVETAPTILIFHPHKDEVDKLVNPSPEALSEEIAKHNEEYKDLTNIREEIEKIISSSSMVCFIKGTPTEPKCKFTRRLLAHFNDLEIANYGYCNILENPKIRAWLKVYSNWKTFPQIYINKEFVGGIDIVSELIEEGEFMNMVPKECKKQSPLEIFNTMLGSFDVVVFINGQPDSPKDDSSKSILKTLDENSIKYVTVDYTSLEEEVINSLKAEVSEFPYIFLKKKPFGTEADLLKVISEGALESTIPEGSRKQSLNDRLEKFISTSSSHY